jgi:hypothetical protein
MADEVPKAPKHSDGHDKPETKPGATSPDLATGNQGHGVKPGAIDSQKTLKGAGVPDPEGKTLLDQSAAKAFKDMTGKGPSPEFKTEAGGGSHSQIETPRKPVDSKPLENWWSPEDKASLKGKFAESTAKDLEKSGFPKEGVAALAASGMKDSSVSEMLKAGVPVDQIRNLAVAGATAKELSKSSDPTMLRALGSQDVDAKAKDLAAAYADKSPEGIKKLMPQFANDAKRAEAMVASIESRLKNLSVQV